MLINLKNQRKRGLREPEIIIFHYITEHQGDKMFYYFRIVSNFNVLFVPEILFILFLFFDLRLYNVILKILCILFLAVTIL